VLNSAMTQLVLQVGQMIIGQARKNKPPDPDSDE